MVRALAALCVALLLLASPVLADGPGKRDVKKAFKSGDRASVQQVLEELKGQLDKSTVKAILDDARRIKSLGVYDTLVATLASAQGDALQELIKAYKKEKKHGDMRFLILDALGGVPGAEAEEVLVTALEDDKDEPVRVLAARLLGRRGTASAVDALIPLLATFEGEGHDRLVREVNGALVTLTGQDIGVAEDWKNYWTAHRDSYTRPVGDGDTKTRGNVLDRMAKERPADLKTITRLRDDEIIVIKGNDRCEQVLKALDLKFVLIQRSEFDSRDLDPERQVLILNCPGRDEFTPQGIEKVRAFVAAGGYLFCSDWELGKTLTKVFPGIVEFLKETPYSKEPRDVTIAPYPQTISHPLMRDVFPLNSWTEQAYAWKLEGRSHLAKPSPALIPLVRCPDIADLGTDCVAFTLSYDRQGRPVTGRGNLERRAGRVLFVSSHFKLQKDEKGDGFALQQLLLNFIVEKQDQRKASARGS